MATTIKATTDKVRFVQGTEATYDQTANKNDFFVCSDTGHLFIRGMNLTTHKRAQTGWLRVGQPMLIDTGVYQTGTMFLVRLWVNGYSATMVPQLVIVQGYLYKDGNSAINVLNYGAVSMGGKVSGLNTMRIGVRTEDSHVLLGFTPETGDTFTCAIVEVEEVGNYHNSYQHKLAGVIVNTDTEFPTDAVNSTETITVVHMEHELTMGTGLARSGNTLSVVPANVLDAIGTATDTPSDDTYYIATGQTASDGAYYRRKLSTLYAYLLGKLPDASASAKGLMTAEQASELSALQTTVEGTVQPALDNIPSGIEASQTGGGLTVQLKAAGLIGSATTLPAATLSANGVMTATQATKLAELNQTAQKHEARLTTLEGAVPLQIACTYADMSQNPKDASATLDVSAEDAWNKITSAFTGCRVLFLKYKDPDDNYILFTAKQIGYPQNSLQYGGAACTATVAFDGFTLSVTKGSDGTYSYAWS